MDQEMEKKLFFVLIILSRMTQIKMYTANIMFIKLATWTFFILFILSENDKKYINVKYMQQIGFMEIENFILFFYL